MLKGQKITIAEITERENAKKSGSAILLLEGVSSLQSGDVIKFANDVEINLVPFGTNNYYAVVGEVNGESREIAVSNFFKKDVFGASVNPTFDCGLIKLIEKLSGKSLEVSKKVVEMQKFIEGETKGKNVPCVIDGKNISVPKSVNVFTEL